MDVSNNTILAYYNQIFFGSKHFFFKIHMIMFLYNIFRYLF